MSRLARPMLLATVALTAGCMFNVTDVTTRATADSPGAVTSIRSDLTGLGPIVGVIEVTGAARSDAHADLALAGFAPVGSSVEAIERAIMLVWDGTAEPTVLRASYSGPALESIWIESLRLDVPLAAQIDLDVTDVPVDVSGVAAPVRVHGTSGRISVVGATSADLANDQGNVVVTAGEATVATRAGGVVVDAGLVQIVSEAGPVEGSIRNGGTVSTASGSIRVDLTGALTRDLELTSELGEITLRVARDASLELDLESGSWIHATVAELDYHGRGRLTERLGEGGFLVVVRSEATIRVEEL